MKDEEVGKLWLMWHPQSTVGQLIRRLVDERVRYYQAVEGWGSDYSLGATLDDFNIKIKDWK